MKIRLLSLLLVLMLLAGLAACAAPEQIQATPAGISFPVLEEIESVTIAYTSVLTETQTETIKNPETIAALCAAIAEAGAGRLSVSWNPITRSVDGGEGYVLTFFDASGETCRMQFVLNPTLGYLACQTTGGEQCYFSLGEEALKTIAAFYPV